LGVWVLRYASEYEVPKDSGMVRMALDMDEKIEAMRKFGAEFVADVSEVEELSDHYPQDKGSNFNLLQAALPIVHRTSLAPW
jgi:hypothetical protein